jgi:glucose/arabinose dehydrogenase
MPDGRFLIVDAKRRLRIVGTDGKTSAPIGGVPEFETPGAAGIMDIALDPGFAGNHTLYIGIYAPKPGAPAGPGGRPELASQIVKARLSAAGDALEGVTPIWQGGYHVRRLLPRRDGTLIFTSAYGGNNPAGDDDTGQELGKDGGKVLRIRTDGSMPKDNPFAARAGALPSVYAYGLRDPDGLTQDAQGRIWTVEHGPRGGDELNQIGAGKNYGYPAISYGRTYGELAIDNGLTAKDGMEQPVYFWTPDIAPSGLLVYSGSMFPAWKGDVFLGGLVAESLVRLTLKNGRVASEEFMLAPRCKRVRDVRQGRDGAIYLITDADDGELLRLVPDKATKTASR